MKCNTCFHECTMVDFSTLRNLCEHLYLDSLARKQRFPLISEEFPFLESENVPGELVKSEQ